jgi:hypothetical protein
MPIVSDAAQGTPAKIIAVCKAVIPAPVFVSAMTNVCLAIKAAYNTPAKMANANPSTQPIAPEVALSLLNAADVAEIMSANKANAYKKAETPLAPIFA